MASQHNQRSSPAIGETKLLPEIIKGLDPKFPTPSIFIRLIQGMGPSFVKPSELTRPGDYRRRSPAVLCLPRLTRPWYLIRCRSVLLSHQQLELVIMGSSAFLFFFPFVSPIMCRVISPCLFLSLFF